MAKSERLPKILTLDTETIGLDGDLKRIAIYDGKQVVYGYKFDDVLPFIEECYNQGFMPHIYIHNLDFDARKIPQIFKKGNVVWGRTQKIGNKFARIVCRKFVLHDSFKILPFSLKKLSKDFDLQNGKLNLYDEVKKAYGDEYSDEVDFLNRCDVDNELYLKYLGLDVISLYELVYKIMDISGLDEERFTHILSTASLSRNIFKNGYKGIQFKSDENDKTDYEILTSCKAWSSKKKMKFSSVTYEEVEYKIREAFFGGRTEVFTPFLKPKFDEQGNNLIVARHYDVNSLYPSQMVDSEFPVGFPSYEDNSKIIKFEFEKWLETHKGLGFLKVVIKIPQQKIPPLPCKMGKLAFVCGIIEGFWSYHEIEYAIKNCGAEILEYKEQIHFNKSYKVFKNFVTFFYKMKEDGKRQGNVSLTSFAKLILNTAYGWTALRRDDKTAFRDIKMLEKYEDTDKLIYTDEELGCIEIRDTVFAESVQVQIGAYVTSYARLVLLDGLRKQAEKGEIYYCDTDSIVCEAEMPNEIVDPYKIGLWDCEAELYSGLFLQPKVYWEHKKDSKDTIKFKGVSKAVQSGLNKSHYEQIYNLMCEGKPLRVLIEKERKSLPSLPVALKNKQNPNNFKVIDKSINICTEKPKRDFDYKNNTSKAWYMDSLEMYYNFSFGGFKNPPTGANIFGG